MANNTERIILGTFEEMLEEMPFYKITVSALVKRCGISPNTFYYHYEDIHALLEKWTTVWLSQFAPQEDWKENAKALLRTCQERERLVGNVLNYLSKKQIEQALFSQDDDDFLYVIIKKASGGKDIPDSKLRNIADFCRYAIIGFFLRFVWNHSSGDVDTVVEDLDNYIRCFVKAALERESVQLNAPAQ